MEWAISYHEIWNSYTQLGTYNLSQYSGCFKVVFQSYRPTTFQIPIFFMLNMFELCLSFATILTNIYRMESNLFIDITSLLSQEGTTQGNPLAIPMCAISLVPVIQHLRGAAKQVWHADDAAAGPAKELLGQTLLFWLSLWLQC